MFPVLPRPQLALQLSLAGCSLCCLWAGASQGRMEPSCYELSYAQPALHPQKEMKPSQPAKGRAAELGPRMPGAENELCVFAQLWVR